MTDSVNLPFHLRRYLANLDGVPSGYTSILIEMTLCLVAPLEAVGYSLPENLWPDISMGKMLPRYLGETAKIKLNECPTYWHQFEGGRRSVMARAYPDHLIPWVRRYIREDWLPNKAVAYFQPRDADALPYLASLIRKRAA